MPRSTLRVSRKGAGSRLPSLAMWVKLWFTKLLLVKSTLVNHDMTVTRVEQCLRLPAVAALEFPYKPAVNQFLKKFDRIDRPKATFFIRYHPVQLIRFI